MFIDLQKPSHAYMFGFLQADGHLTQGTRHRGRLQVEVSAIDRPILEQFAGLINCCSSIKERTRNTNFKPMYQSVTWTVCNRKFREELIDLGLPTGKKSSHITLPHVPFCKTDYFRGLVDADGSVGMTTKELPFVSLTTRSDIICEGFRDYIYEVTGQRKLASRGSRDGIYNILVMREHAQLLIEQMYYPGSLALPRKQEKAQQVLSWKRPDNMRIAPPHKSWIEEEDVFILSHTIEEAIAKLQRSKQSVKMRLYRLKLEQ